MIKESGHLSDDQFEITSAGRTFKIEPGAFAGDHIIEILRRTSTFYESDLLDWVTTLKLPEGRVIDGGAFVGNHTLYFAGVLERCVTAYEPNPQAFEVLKRHVALNKLAQQVTVRNVGLGVKRGRANLIASPQENNSGGTSIASDDGGAIDIVSLDEDLNEEEPIALIKLDIEGSESNAIAGAHRILQTQAPLLLIECMTTTAFAAMRESLTTFDYLPIGIHAVTPVFAFAHRSKADEYFADGRATAFDRSYHDYRANVRCRDEANAQARRVTNLARRQDERAERASKKQAQSIRRVSNEIEAFRSASLEAAKSHEVEVARLLTLLERAQTRAERQDVIDIAAKYEQAEKLRLRLETEAANYSNALATARADAVKLNAKLKVYRQSVTALQAYTQALRSSTALRVGLMLTMSVRRPHALIAKITRRLTGRTRPETDPTRLPPAPTSMNVPHPDRLGSGIAVPGKGEASFRTMRRKVRSSPFPVSDLRLALIADEFTRLNLGATCHVRNLTPKAWASEISGFEVDILFIESAWQGVDGLWHRKLKTLPPALKSILAAARAANIPVMFWNKEDPIHNKVWLPLAGLVDHVFTTDIESIPAYVAALGHDRVSVLPFACAPALTNPIANIPRTTGTSFAGSYYHRYPDRAADLDMLADLARDRGALTIYDRNSEKNYADFQFPERFSPHLKPSLPFERIAEAYKGYDVGINMNSVRQSPTMFARRVFELMASNTLVLSNFSHGMRLFFGDLVMSGETSGPIRRRLESLKATRETERLRLRALRKVLSEHTYAHRLAEAAQKLGVNAYVGSCSVEVLASASTKAEVDRICTAIRVQEGVDARLTLRLTGDATGLPRSAFSLPLNAAVLSSGEGDTAWSSRIGEASAKTLVAVFSPGRTYGPSYLRDLVLSRHYHDGDGSTRADGVEPYTMVDAAVPSRSVFTAERVRRVSLEDLLSDAPVKGDFLSIDSFNIGGPDDRPAALDAEPFTAEGVSMDAIAVATAHCRSRALVAKGDRFVLEGTDLNDAFSPPDREGLSFEAGQQGPRFDSNLPMDGYAYAYLTDTFDIDQLRDPDDDDLTVSLEAEGDALVQAVITFHDADGNKIAPALPPANRVRRITVPDGTRTARLGVRIAGPGKIELRSFRFGRSDDSAIIWVPRADTLILARGYPSYDDIYRSGFVHRRVRTYWDEGMPCDVLRFDAHEPVRRYEFEGIDVTLGHEAELTAALASGAYKRVLVHFLDAKMWTLLKPYLGQIEVTVWLHGSDVQPWHRREFNYTDEATRERAMKLSASREALWQDVFETNHPFLRFVFVAEYARREIEEDYGVHLPEHRYEVVHNFIDTDLFAYVPKPKVQRFRALSIRPFASRKYANDITVEAICLLSEREGFDNYSFRLIGDGDLFDETVAPVRHLPNVEITQGFLRQSEIAALHRDYGVWLSPTRMDWQGVSRDEAMSSGLVPVTTDCTAIPEFVDESCGFLCPPEDPKALADAFERIAQDASLFEKLSKAAAERVRGQSGLERTIKREIDIVRPSC